MVEAPADEVAQHPEAIGTAMFLDVAEDGVECDGVTMDVRKDGQSHSRITPSVRGVAGDVVHVYADTFECIA
jgi:hypothetical protein